MARNSGAILNALQAEKRAVPVGLKAIAKPIEYRIKLKVLTPYPPASRPGQPAHRRTGRYYRAWRVLALDNVLSIRNRMYYASFLEAGTRYMKARPALTGVGGGAAAFVRRAARAGIGAGRRNLGGN